MAKNLKKFVNLAFLKTIDLTLMRRLLERHEACLSGLDLANSTRSRARCARRCKTSSGDPRRVIRRGVRRQNEWDR